MNLFVITTEVLMMLCQARLMCSLVRISAACKGLVNSLEDKFHWVWNDDRVKSRLPLRLKQ